MSSGIAIAMAPVSASALISILRTRSCGMRPASAFSLSWLFVILTFVMTNPMRGYRHHPRLVARIPPGTWLGMSRVGDHDQRLGAAEDAGERAFQRLGIERREAFVQHAHVERLQQRTRDEQAAAFAVRQLPAAVAHQLLEPRRHARDQRSEIELARHRLGLDDVLATRRPGAPEQQVEEKAGGEDVVLVKLRRRADAATPAP